MIRGGTHYAAADIDETDRGDVPTCLLSSFVNILLSSNSSVNIKKSHDASKQRAFTDLIGSENK